MGGEVQVPKRQYTLQDLRLHNIEPQNLLSPEDKTLKTIRNVLQVSISQAQPQHILPSQTT